MMLQKVPPKELYEVMEIGVHPALVNLRPHELKLIKDKSSLAKGVFQQLMATYEAEVGQYATYVPELGKLQYLHTIPLLWCFIAPIKVEQIDIANEEFDDEHEREDDLELEPSSLDTSYINSKLSQDNLEDYCAFKKDMTRRVLVLEGKIERIRADVDAIEKQSRKEPENANEEKLDAGRRLVYYKATNLHVRGPSSREEIIGLLNWEGSLLAVQERMDVNRRTYFNVVVKDEFAGNAIFALHGQKYNGISGICRRSNRQMDIPSLIQDHGVGGESHIVCYNIYSVAVVGEREKDSREIVGPGARRGNFYGGREGLDSPQRMRKRGSSGGSLCSF